MHRFLALALCWLFVGCAEPPLREMANAETQLENARKAGAGRYAPDRLRESQAALDVARQQLQRKDYDGARSSARNAATAARAAVQGAAAARTLARGTADVARTEVHVAMEEIETLLQEASTAKVPEAAFEELKPRLDAAREGLGKLDQILAAGEASDALEARDAALALKSQVGDLPAAFRAARTKWEEEHPKGRRRKG